MKNQTRDEIIAVSGLVVLLTLVATPFVVTYQETHYNERMLTCHVIGKDRGGKDDSMRVYTSDCGVFDNEDSAWRGKYNSADIFSQVQPGRVQTFHVVGWRNGFLSDFPNILEVK